MRKPNPFAEKLVNRFDRVDKAAVKNYVLDLVRENAAYREIFHHLAEGLVVVDENNQILEINGAASSWLGPHLLPGNKPKFLNQISDSGLARFLEQNLSDLKNPVVGDIHVLNPEAMNLRVHLIPLTQSHTPMSLIILDNQTETKSESLDSERIARIESLIALAAGFAHEIGNPLNSLAIHLQLLKRDISSLPKPKRKGFEDHLDVIQSETERLDRIVRDFLKATRKPPLRFRLEDLNKLLEEALEFMKPELSKHKVSVIFRPSRRISPFLLDRDRLYQACINLIKNAMESMPRGGRLQIASSHQGRIAVLQFKDQGKGIPGERLPHIFDPYYTTKEEGSGLGLMTVYNAISEHGGRIEVSSKMGKGTTFSLLIPMQQPKLQLPKYDLGQKK